MMAGFLKHESVEEVVLYEIDEVRDNSHIRSNNTPTYFIIKLLCGSRRMISVAGVYTSSIVGMPISSILVGCG